MDALEQPPPGGLPLRPDNRRATPTRSASSASKDPESSPRPASVLEKCTSFGRSALSAVPSAASARSAHPRIAMPTSWTARGTSDGTTAASCSAHRSARSSLTLVTTAATCPPLNDPSSHAPAVTGADRSRLAVRAVTVASRPVMPALRRSQAVWEVSPSTSHSWWASSSATAIATLTASRSCRCSSRASAAESAGMSSSSIASASTSNMTPPYARGCDTRPVPEPLWHRGLLLQLSLAHDHR